MRFISRIESIEHIKAQCEDGTLRIENPLENVIDPKSVSEDAFNPVGLQYSHTTQLDHSIE